MSAGANAPLGGATPPGKRGTSGNTGDPEAFETIVDRAIGLRLTGQASGSPAADDPDPVSLLRYAAGGLDGAARAEVEAWLQRSRWAYDCVLALVRQGRSTAKKPALTQTLARRLLDSARSGRGKLEVSRAISEAFVEAGAALAASTGGPASPTADTERAIAAALARGDEREALLQALTAIARPTARGVV